jgi:6-phosphogluconolactonase
MPNLEIEIAPADELARRFAARLAIEARRAISAHGRCALALPGGSVAETFVPALAAAEVPWAGVELCWVDERAVPPDDPESNFGLARRAGLDRLPLREAGVHRLPAEADDLEAAATLAERELRAALGVERIDVALVGVGADGHVASLFPGHPALAEHERWIVAVRDAPKPPPRRLTWTLAAFAHVDLLVVAAFGAAKAAAIAAACAPLESELPIARAAAAAARRLVLADTAAAGRISR